MKKIYVAGPMRGYDLWNFPAFDKASAFLRERGWQVFSPAEMDRELGFDETGPAEQFTEADWHSAMRRDYDAILEVDAVAFLPGWEKSVGANAERSFAARMPHIDFYRLNPKTESFVRELIVGVSGYAQSGKDTLAALLVEHDGFQRRAFADAMRNVMYALNPIIEAEVSPGETHLLLRGTRLSAIVDDVGWERAKLDYPEIRALLQRLGTEGGRQHIADDVWVRTLFESPHGPYLVVPDTRFPNEAKKIRERHGLVLRIERPGFTPVNRHISETAIDDFDFDAILVNDGTPEDLYEKAREVILSHFAP